MNKQQAQLKELFRMQSELDTAVFKKHEIKKYPLHNMVIALFVELGEMMNELPTTFKHWKLTAVDNHEAALEEFVDCLHFAMSLMLYLHGGKQLKNDLTDDEIDYLFPKYEEIKGFDPSIAFLLIEIADYENEMKLQSLFLLGLKLGFTWDEIYDKYKYKNNVNHTRQEQGY